MFETGKSGLFIILTKGFKHGRIRGMQIELEKKIAAGLSITSNALIILLKIAAGIISGSISIISEAIHSLSDFLASVLTFFSITKSSEPADASHPFGHGRYEDMSGFIEGGLIIFAALYIMYQAIKKLVFGSVMEIENNIGIIVMFLAIAANFLVSSYLFNVAKRSNSVSLLADGQHLRTDVYSSAGVLIGLVLIKITGIYLLDSVVAIIVAVFIFKAGFSISRTTLNNLLDGSLPEKDLNEIKNIIRNFKDSGITNYKSLKTRSMGSAKDIELTLLFPSKMTICECHKICDDVESMIWKKLGNCFVSIHAEPECNRQNCKKKCEKV